MVAEVDREGAEAKESQSSEVGTPEAPSAAAAAHVSPIAAAGGGSLVPPDGAAVGPGDNGQ